MKAAAAGGDAELTRYLEEKLDMVYDVGAAFSVFAAAVFSTCCVVV
ncbi:hypothetical protein PC123_g24043 [Phytophthora cactorum]|nr:hypothetical protein PC123_g24043 [Phytophthora cactorum]